jgi:NitT/TauT family transport system ATP-binding protein
MTDEPAIVVEHLTRSFARPKGERLEVLHDLSFQVRTGGLVSILGPSGCGKSTLLNILAGLDGSDEGRVSLQGERVGFVFQKPRLLDWRTVRRNVELALEEMNLSKTEMRSRAERYLHLTGLQGYEDYYPRQVSGGMQQRIAIARALAVHSPILLMDEPFSGLDAITAERMREELIRIWQETGKTILFVTHDISEAAFLSQQVLFMTAKPASIHTTATIDLPYPRRRDDERIFAHDRELRRRFHAMVS